MKRNPKSARVLQRILNARQFCLKLIANVTYGYTAAGFSGRMPMAELADSIVQACHCRTLSSRILQHRLLPETLVSGQKALRHDLLIRSAASGHLRELLLMCRMLGLWAARMELCVTPYT